MPLPKRKHPRLKGYDYSQPGFYHAIISTLDNRPILSRIERGTDPAIPAVVRLTPIGRVCREQLNALPDRFSMIYIDQSVIMPTHIHLLVQILPVAAGASPRPTLDDVLCAYKSLVTRMVNRQDGIEGRQILQTSFYEEVIRNQQVYYEVAQYIQNNPIKWLEYHTL